MLIHLHSQATTTPKVRAAIQASDEPGTVLAERFGDEEDQKTVRGTVFPPNARRYLFVAIDRATRWVFIRIFKAKTAANAHPAPSG
jgi:hypothetical protein